MSQFESQFASLLESEPFDQRNPLRWGGRLIERLEDLLRKIDLPPKDEARAIVQRGLESMFLVVDWPGPFDMIIDRIIEAAVMASFDKLYDRIAEES